MGRISKEAITLLLPGERKLMNLDVVSPADGYIYGPGDLIIFTVKGGTLVAECERCRS